MTTGLLIAATILLLSLVLGLIRIWRGPGDADRMLTAQLFGTTGVAMLLLLATALDLPYLRDVALVLALLAAVATIAFVQRVIPAPRHPSSPDAGPESASSPWQDSKPPQGGA